ncbi:MAG TPA: enoyl-CoA hydratase-related protein [Streptosporangiaceae bacterium]|nr:enoyl-CoA hydratase-related protein [Streptosporangiaceae bacterium]
MTDSVVCQTNGAVLTITLNRPKARNALTAEMKVSLLAALGNAAADAAVRAVVITGAGDGFCAGQDLREHAAILESGEQPTDTVREHYNPIITTVMGMPKPVVAAVNGNAAGAGASLALACDFRVAAQRASFLMAFARVGLGPDSGASWTLQRLVGAGRAAELLMLAEPITAERALAAGLVTSVVADDELAAAADALATRLAAGPTAAYAAIKSELAYAATHDLADSLENEARWQARLGMTADHRAATLAFVRKEQPVFYGQ